MPEQNIDRLIDFTNRATLLQDFLNSDEILEMTDEEFLLLEQMHKGLEVYCTVLKRRILKEVSIHTLHSTIGEQHG
jgi:hypothetical protein